MSVDKLTTLSALNIIDIANNQHKGEESGIISIEESRQEEKSPNKQELEKFVENLNDLVHPVYTHVNFKLHEKLNEYYITVVDNSTNEVIREIPSKKWLDIYAAMTDFVGLIVDKKI
ncbi:flagellar protein FlaG [Metabacillus sp. HB246100]